MEIVVKRRNFTDKSSIGNLYIDGTLVCFTLEDKTRGVNEPKVPGQTAIPYGRYEVVIDMSNRFKKLMPHILDVPNFTGIRIHSGNTDKDTEGCILLGMNKGYDVVTNSRAAYDVFYVLLEKGLEKGKVFITIEKA